MKSKEKGKTGRDLRRIIKERLESELKKGKPIDMDKFVVTIAYEMSLTEMLVKKIISLAEQTGVCIIEERIDKKSEFYFDNPKIPDFGQPTKKWIIPIKDWAQKRLV